MDMGTVKDMFIILTYDINRTDGGRRLQKVAKVCEGYGIRVQDSVFELQINRAELIELKAKLNKIIDRQHDSIRIYTIGKVPSHHVEILGINNEIELSIDTPIML